MGNSKFYATAISDTLQLFLYTLYGSLYSFASKNLDCQTRLEECAYFIDLAKSTQQIANGHGVLTTVAGPFMAKMKLSFCRAEHFQPLIFCPCPIRLLTPVHLLRQQMDQAVAGVSSGFDNFKRVIDWLEQLLQRGLNQRGPDLMPCIKKLIQISQRLPLCRCKPSRAPA